MPFCFVFLKTSTLSWLASIHLVLFVLSFFDIFFTTFFFLVPPTFVESPKNQTIPKGHTASFPCTALGDPRPSITWYKSHDLVTSNARYHILANQTLVIYSATAQDSGSLTCRAMNKAGTREAKAYLLVAGLAFIFL